MMQRSAILILLMPFCKVLCAISVPAFTNSDAEVCCIPADWEAHMYLDYGTVFIDQNTAYAYINGSVHAAYSYTQKKVFFNITGVELSPLIPRPVPSDSILLYDFANNRSYIVSGGGECQKSSLDQSMIRYCIPGTVFPPYTGGSPAGMVCSSGIRNGGGSPSGIQVFTIPEGATELSSGVFGSGKITGNVNTYQYTTDNDLPLEITATVRKHGISAKAPVECDPISVSFFTPTANPDSGSLYNLNIVDIGPLKTEGIFDVPKSCL